MRRLFALAAAALLAGCTSGGSGSGSEPGSGAPPFSMVTDVGGLGDESLHYPADRGLHSPQHLRAPLGNARQAPPYPPPSPELLT